MKIDVSIIIVNYNTSSMVIDCVKSLIHKTSGIIYEIIVVDNSSENVASLKELELLGVKILYNDVNKGFGNANNEGLKIARGRNILFLNPDTLLLNNAVKWLSDFLDSNPSAGACGGNLYDPEQRPTYSFNRLFPGVMFELNELLHHLPISFFYRQNKYFNFSSYPIKVATISGADLIVKKCVLDEIGKFDKDFFMYYEDTDLCRRIKKKKWLIFNVPESKMVHLESSSFNRENGFENSVKNRYQENSRSLYYIKNNSELSRKLSNFIYDVFLFSRILLLSQGKKKAYYKMRRKYFKISSRR